MIYQSAAATIRCRRAGGLLAALLVTGCGGESPKLQSGQMLLATAAGGAAACRVVDAGRPLPKEARESSGLARSRRDPTILWTHNDAGNEPVLLAVDAGGALAGQVRLEGATLEDWEDIAVGPCSGGHCLYVGDIGDNEAVRRSITVYRVEEPAPDAASAGPATAMRAKYGDGARDAEALFVIGSRVYIVTKGRTGPIELYRYPATTGGSEVGTLEKLGVLLPAPKSSADRVTAAAASPDGRWVGIRTYRTLHLYRAAALTDDAGAREAAITMDLRPLKEAKGEGLAIADDGTVWLSSEAEKKSPPRLARLECVLPAQNPEG
jgi:hypothetical protein